MEKDESGEVGRGGEGSSFDFEDDVPQGRCSFLDT